MARSHRAIGQLESGKGPEEPHGIRGMAKTDGGQRAAPRIPDARGIMSVVASSALLIQKTIRRRRPES